MDRFQRLALSQASDLPHAITSSSMISSQLFASYLNYYFPAKVQPTGLLDMSYFIISGIHKLPQKGAMLQKASSALP